jgi:hypothetical protein
MDATAALVTVGLGAGLAVLVGVGVYLSRSRARVMGYHDIPTPRTNESTHGGGPAD